MMVACGEACPKTIIPEEPEAKRMRREVRGKK
jgi:hypothetical protein